jgi:protein-disulfide isomerase
LTGLSRAQIAFAAAVALIAGVLFATLWLRPGPDLAFEERRDLPGFRQLAGTGGAGLTGALALLPAGPSLPLPDDLCRALFADPGDPVVGDGPVDLALFSDYQCPYCRVLSGLVLARAERGAVRAVFKEWPVLGPGSVTAARLALAADAQGDFARMHARLMRTAFIPTPDYAREVGEDTGLDPDRLLADMEDPARLAHFERVAALAGAFGFRGTPAMVVGRTVVEGAITEAQLDALIAAEAEGPGCVSG